MNWTLALPEIVLAVIGLAVLIIGVLQKRDAVTICTMLTIGGFVIAFVLVLAGGDRKSVV